MEDYVYVNGKQLKRGLTTGTCATAAAVAAVQMILQQDRVDVVEVETASGQLVTMQVLDPSYQEREATAAIEKDGGDDADATHGLWIYATVTLLADSKYIRIDGGQGVGRVTQKGLAISPGQAAINPTPRRVIEKAVRQLIGPDLGADIIIWVPEGAERAKLTYNSRLGIEGGISILGTTGIVNPMSEESWKAAITVELNMLYQQGRRSVILVPGNYGEDFVKHSLEFSGQGIVNMSNFIGHVLKEVQRIGFSKVLMVGHLGKLGKVAAGIFSTHSKDADARMETLIANLALLGAPLELLKEVDTCLTTESAGQVIAAYGYQEVYQVLADKIKQRSERLLKYRKPQVSVDVVLFSSEQGYLASTKALAELKEEWQ